MVIFAPNRIEPFVNLVCCCCRAAIRRKLREQELKEESLGKGKSRYSGRYSMAGMNANPLMLRAMGGAGPALDGEDAGIGSDGLIQLDVVNSIDAPSKAVWAKVQQSYGRVFGMMDSLQHEIRLLKRQHAEATSSGPTLGAVPTALSRNRRQFKPVQRALDEEEPGALGGAGGEDAGGAAPGLRSPSASPAGHLAGMAGFASADTRRMRRTSTAAAAAARMNAAGAISPAGAGGSASARRASRMSMSMSGSASPTASSPGSVLYPGDDGVSGSGDATGRSPLVGASPRSTLSTGRRSTSIAGAAAAGARRMTAAARASMLPRSTAGAAAGESAVEIELSSRGGYDESAVDASSAAAAGAAEGSADGAYAYSYGAEGSYAYGEGYGEGATGEYAYGDASGAAAGAGGYDDASGGAAADPYYASGAPAAAGSASRRGTYSAYGGRASARPSMR